MGNATGVRSPYHLLDRTLLRLPQSTGDWSCPWFRQIVRLSVLAIICAVVAAAIGIALPALIVGTASGGLLGFVIGQRRGTADPDNPSCET